MVDAYAWLKTRAPVADVLALTAATAAPAVALPNGRILEVVPDTALVLRASLVQDLLLPRKSATTASHVLDRIPARSLWTAHVPTQGRSLSNVPNPGQGRAPPRKGLNPVSHPRSCRGRDLVPSVKIEANQGAVLDLQIINC